MSTGARTRLGAAVAAAFAFCPLVMHAPAFGQTAVQAEPASAELVAEIRRLREEVARLRGEVDAIKRNASSAAAAATIPADTAPTRPALAVGRSGGAAPAAAAEMAGATRSGAGAAADARTGPVGAAAPPVEAVAGAGDDYGGRVPPEGSGVYLFGYGEMLYSRPRGQGADTVATVRRGVLGFGYRFDERTRMAIELELENAIASSSDNGEIAFEQFYVERDLTDRLAARAGLFLLPVGYLNEVHEPTRYYGVQRNFVETAIIPTTWRELGIGLRGTTEAGLRYDAGLVTGFDLGRWDATSTEGRESPLGAIHQEGSLARASSLAGYGALNWNGWPGINLGGSVFRGGAGQRQPGFAAADASVTLAEAHARWSPGRWDLSALVAGGRFDRIAALNATFAGQPVPVPERFGGWYVQAAHRTWTSGEYVLAPFARYERFNTARGFPGLPAGLAPPAQADTRVMTAGANFYLNPQVVLKVDYQRFVDRVLPDRFNLGVGFHY